MLVTVRLNCVYVLVVAARPLPDSLAPACPECGGDVIYVS